MSKLIDEVNAFEHHQRLMRLASAQDDFLERYSAMIPDHRRRDDFRRELIYLIHLAYREAQEPLVKQLTDFVMTQNRPVILEKSKP